MITSMNQLKPLTEAEEQELQVMENEPDPVKRVTGNYYNLSRRSILVDYGNDIRDGMELKEATDRLESSLDELRKELIADLHASVHLFLQSVPGIISPPKVLISL